jgi:hypothetical protein
MDWTIRVSFQTPEGILFASMSTLVSKGSTLGGWRYLKFAFVHLVL